MRALVQRVHRAEVCIAEQSAGKIGRGLLVFLGVGKNDGHKEIQELVDKIIHLRIFENDQGKFDRSLVDIDGEVLLVSQFTLYADCRKGRRPSFSDAAPPESARETYSRFLRTLGDRGIRVASGRFGERMDVHLVNDGPVTIWLETNPASSSRRFQ
jgi:D-tyrosyl-tRNA(Tyr) deacylase